MCWMPATWLADCTITLMSSWTGGPNKVADECIMKSKAFEPCTSAHNYAFDWLFSRHWLRQVNVLNAAPFYTVITQLHKMWLEILINCLLDMKKEWEYKYYALWWRLTCTVYLLDKSVCFCRVCRVFQSIAAYLRPCQQINWGML